MRVARKIGPFLNVGQALDIKSPIVVVFSKREMGFKEVRESIDLYGLSLRL
jgi:hypothetical protein